MRTTVDLYSDLAAELRQISRERGITFKEALNSTLRAGLEAQVGVASRYRLRSRRLGLRPGFDLDRTLHLAAAQEDEETVRKLRSRE
jgi:hypothetical protein